MQEKNLLYNKEQLEAILSGSVHLYGAGRVAKTVIKYAARQDFSIAGIFVSNAEGNPTQIMGVPVVLFSKENSDEKVILVSVKENLHEEIEKELSKYTCAKRYFISDVLFDMLTYELADFELDVWSQTNALVMKNQYLKTKIDEITHFLKTHFFEDKVLYNRSIENESIRENWGDVVAKEEFPEKYNRLIRNLDEESMTTVMRILNRVKICLENEALQIDFYTRKECEELIFIKENFKKLVIKHSDNLYLYKNYLLPKDYFLPGVFLYKHGVEKAKSILTVRGKTILDVGGYIGDSVLVFEELEPKKIISFEAIKEHIDLLNKTVELNGLDNVEVVHSALGNYNGMITMNLHGSSSTCIDMKGVQYDGFVDVPIMTLDRYVFENDINDIALIKVDIEGAEQRFLDGAKETIHKFRPILLLSIYHSSSDFFAIKPMIEAWNLGYKFTIYKPTDGSIVNDTVLIAECIE